MHLNNTKDYEKVNLSLLLKLKVSVQQFETYIMEDISKYWLIVSNAFPLQMEILENVYPDI